MSGGRNSSVTEPTDDHIEEIFIAALERKPAERAAYLDQACGDDEALKARVKELLEAHEKADDVLRPPSEPTATLLGVGPGSSLEGQRIGHYTIRRVIATGGMGVVYEAMQEQPHRTPILAPTRPALSRNWW